MGGEFRGHFSPSSQTAVMTCLRAGLEWHAARHCRRTLPLDQRPRFLGRRCGACQRKRRRGSERLVCRTVRSARLEPSRISCTDEALQVTERLADEPADTLRYTVRPHSPCHGCLHWPRRVSSVPHYVCVTGFDGQGALHLRPASHIPRADLYTPPQIWDISTSPASLLSTFSFPHPVTHIAFDSLERYFFAAGPASVLASSAATSASTADAPAPGSRVVRVNLYRQRKDEYGIEVAEPVGGGGRGEVERVGEGPGNEGEVYEVA